MTLDAIKTHAASLTYGSLRINLTRAQTHDACETLGITTDELNEKVGTWGCARTALESCIAAAKPTTRTTTRTEPQTGSLEAMIQAVALQGIGSQLQAAIGRDA
jgi:hypothetical protein